MDEEVDFDILVDELVVAPGCESIDPPPDEPAVLCATRAGASARRPVKVAMAIRLLFLLMVFSLPFLMKTAAAGMR
jgi:hypothetical protein